MKFIPTAISVLAVGAVGAGAITMYNYADERNSFVVQSVVDGDTIDVRHKGETERIRLLNIDTPEIGRDGTASECLADEAKEYLQSRLAPGTRVGLEYDEERSDRYGRTLAGVFLGDELINASIAEQGLARAMVIEPNHRFYPEVSDAADRAERSGRGLSTLGPECFVASTVVDQYSQAKEHNDALQSELGLLLPHLNDDENFHRAKALRNQLQKLHHSLSAIPRPFEQSEFQKAAFDSRFDTYADDIDASVKENLDHVNGALDAEDSRREEERRREEEAARAEQARRAENQRQRELQQRDVIAPPNEPSYSPPSSNSSTSNDNSSGSGGAAIDTYTGCRAYGGNYALTSIDKKGRPYAKIDCTTKQQIG